MFDVKEYPIHSKKYDLNGLVTVVPPVAGVSFDYDKNFFSKKIEYELPDDVDEIRKIGVEIMDDFLEQIIDGRVKIKKVRLFHWYVSEADHLGVPYIRCNGNVVNHHRFWNSQWIWTSDIHEIDVQEEIGEIIITTRNTRYHNKIDSWDWDEQDKYPDAFPNYQYFRDKYKVEKEDPVEAGVILLQIADYDSYYFHDIFFREDESTEKMKFHMWPHIGMCQDSFLIQNEDFSIDLRYFPHPENVEFYNVETNGKPFFIENVGTERLYAQTSVGIIKLEPGERKEVIKENAEKEDMILPGGDLYPATIIK